MARPPDIQSIPNVHGHVAMIIFKNPDTDKHAIFVHFQHTGGSSIKEWIEENFNVIYEPTDGVPIKIDKSGYWHKPLSFINYFDIHTCFKFGFVRNPLDWYVTIWHKGLRKRNNMSFRDYVFTNPIDQLPYETKYLRDIHKDRFPKDMGSFTVRFVMLFCDVARIFRMPNYRWVTEFKNLQLADAIVPMEFGISYVLYKLLSETIELSSQHIESLRNFPKINITKGKKHWTEYYDDDMVQEVLNRDRLIFNMFSNYKETFK